MKIDNSDDLIELESNYGFYLKSITKLSIIVELPKLHASSGKAISTSVIMDKINKKAKVKFKIFKILKTTLDFLKLEGELASMDMLEIVNKRIDKSTILLEGFNEPLKVKSSKVKFGPQKYEWETFFRDNLHMDETKPGYRPDTIHIQNLPLKWFGGESINTNLIVNVFKRFGDIRRFHIPFLDELEKKKNSNKVNFKNSIELEQFSSFKKFNFNEEISSFDVYIMYKDYIGFVNAMNGLRGMKLVKYDDKENKYYEYNIKIDFDKLKHLSDKAIRKRKIARKYGINNLDDLKEYKQKIEERKIQISNREDELKVQRIKGENLLIYLLRKIEHDEELKRVQEKVLKEKQLRERLLEEEKKLREKLLERKRNHVLEQLKQKGGLKSIARPVSSSISLKPTSSHISKDEKNNSNLVERNKQNQKPKSFILWSKR